MEISFITCDFFNTPSPKIIAASPITIVPTPDCKSATLIFCANNAPANATTPFASINPNIFNLFSFTPRLTTSCSLFPNALNANPNFDVKI